MSSAALASLLASRQVWQGHAAPSADGESSGWPALDALLPGGGWPKAALSEILLPADGVGELELVLPTLARLSRGERPIFVVAPPYRLYAPGWGARGVVLSKLEILAAAEPNDALWAAEQCLRSASCAAVLSWPAGADERALRRLQVAAAAGSALAFAFRDRRHAVQPSPAALRLEIVARPARQLILRKCRGANPPARPLAWPCVRP